MSKRAKNWIVWLEDISALDYVGEMIGLSDSRDAPIKWVGGGRCVGYEVLAEDKPPDYSWRGHIGWDRRIYWVEPDARCSDAAVL